MEINFAVFNKMDNYESFFIFNFVNDPIPVYNKLPITTPILTLNGKSKFRKRFENFNTFRILVICFEGNVSKFSSTISVIRTL
jgi:hypothetical protein